MTAATTLRERSAILDHIWVIAWTVDRDLRIEAVEGREAVRFQWDAWLGVRLDEAFAECSTVVEAHRSALAGRPAEYSREVAGTMWRIFVDPIREANGEVAGAAAMAVDIGKRETASFSSASTRALVETLPLVVYTASLDDDPRPKMIAPQVEELLGIPASEFTFDLLRDGVHPDDRVRVHAAFDAADEGGENLTVEYRFVRPDGTTVWIEDASRVVRVGDDLFAQGYLLDITDRKRTEKVLARKAEVRHRLATIGRRYLEGASRAEVVEATFRLLADDLDAEGGAILEPRDGALIVTHSFGWNTVGDTSTPGMPARTAHDTLATFVGGPGHVASFLSESGIAASVAVPVISSGGECTAVVSVHSKAGDAFDESDVALVEQVANLVGAVQARDAAEARFLESQRLEAVGQLAAGVAHDFNNMLTVIAGRVTFALRTADETGREHLAQALEATERSRALTSQLLAYSRKQVLERRAVQLSDVVGGVMPMLQTLVSENISLSYAGDDATVLADSAQVENVLVNLAANARDAMPEGGTLLVSTGTADVGRSTARSNDVAPGRYGTISVADTGLGMSPEVRAHIFEPFFTTKAAGVGTGLGLAGAHGTVRQSGGFITVESVVGAGSTFTVHLPLTEERSAAEAAVEEVETRPSAVLLVEDEHVVRELLAEQLTSMGHDVVAVATSAEALQSLTGQRFDVVVTDVGLPGIDGVSLADAVTGAQDGVGVVLMSGYPGDYLEHRHRSAPLLQKPFTAAELNDAVAHALA